jgi:hypothetical protein
VVSYEHNHNVSHGRQYYAADFVLMQIKICGSVFQYVVMNL